MDAPLSSPSHLSSAITIGDQLLSARTLAGYSRKALAERSGVSTDAICAVEGGRGNIQSLEAVLMALGCRLRGQPPELSIGIWLRELRRARRLSLRSAVTLTGVSHPTIMNVEKSLGAIESLVKVLVAYGQPCWIAFANPDISPPAFGRAIVRKATFELYADDARQRLRQLADEGRQYHAIVTDPPYHINNVANWDRGGLAFDAAIWRLCYDVLLPGAYLLAFAAPRTAHRVATALEKSGFEIRDSLAWLFETGAPFGSKDISKAIDAALGAEREVTGTQPKAGKKSSGRSTRLGLPGGFLASQYSGERRDKPVTDEARKWQGYGTRLRPGREDIIVCRKPFLRSSVEANVLEFGVGALNIDGAREQSGRYPSNVMSGYDFDEESWPRQMQVAKPRRPARHGHPAAKPVPLLRTLCRMVCPPGGMILDPFCGAASVGEAALREGYRYTGVEIDPDYVAVACKRLADL